ncbi:polysaccharide biosynthesis protein [Glutamicibacter arilaitensis]|uniref:polysaccharide biosynthesis protein n=1 Tax=Glutamicibacter arilaitensis TaxID=256701 RepID=UPI00384EDFDE
MQLKAAQLRDARLRSLMQIFIDCAIWFLSLNASVVLRYEFHLESVSWLPTLLLGVGAGILHVGVGFYLGLYSGHFAYGSFGEVRAVSISVFVEAAVLTFIVLIFGTSLGIPRSSVLIAFPLALVMMFGVRYLRRISSELSRRPNTEAAPTIVVGAGNAGGLIVRSMMTDPDSPLRPVGLLDDDPSKRRLKLHDVQVLGNTDRIIETARETSAEVLVIAIANAEAALLRRLTDDGVEAGLQVLITPSVQQMVSGTVSVSDLRNIKIEDLLGRQPLDTGVEDIADYVTGKRVLVTGAGGSIGSELCQQIYKFGPKELIMLDRDETGLQHVQLKTVGNGLLDSREVVLANIREEANLLDIFKDRKPEVVFHAAALKHLPMLEQYPLEAWKTNVLGTLNVVNAARAVGVMTFVNISTDKAASPTSVLGHSKRVAEKITSWAAEDTGLKYLSVRFGNVIGSRGSMLPTFQTLIEAGGPLTVTHPEATRFFMTIPEACQLVIQAGGIGRASEVLILDMGQPVRILDIAKRMIAMSGKKIEIVFTGLREGEKLHEVLVGEHEDLERPFHPQISHTHANPLSPDRLDENVWMERMGMQNRIKSDSKNLQSDTETVKP